MRYRDGHMPYEKAERAMRMGFVVRKVGTGTTVAYDPQLRIMVTETGIRYLPSVQDQKAEWEVITPIPMPDEV